MAIDLLDNTLTIEIFYDHEDRDLDDHICVSIVESCPPAERLLRAGKTHLYLTAAEARGLGDALLAAADQSDTITND